MAEAAREQLLASLKGLLASGAHSDFTITCGSDSHKVHKNIVCWRADFFARAIKFGGKETQGSNVDLPEDEPAIVKLLLQYIYEGEYDPFLLDKDTDLAAALYSPSMSPTWGKTQRRKEKLIVERNLRAEQLAGLHTAPTDSSTPTTGSEQLLTHAKMYEIAEKYDVVGLKDLVKEKYDRACSKYWNAPSFAASAYHVFSTTLEHDKGLRDIVFKTIATHMQTLVKKPEVETLLTEFNGLAFGLLKMKIDEGWN
ncbi:BTB domain containing protein [Pyrenophora tritici-repentis]|uniref:BTB domain containing protein n=2 Tax=Pyrenophora tritici-repentis TaxID=45151 RepID=A0A2W1D4M1_9PLEO|nr:uncharacterized protein PTRG_01910 [Pyrenophora tritici-repentis Pt-1C-BFP]KAA8626612.1 BTB domain-containing protein [Pyrenophora tritici-repentis]EDU41348.1 conserved hypothetical protein [Pyrenophora tritici-repentis Pt-1C-BFP]KAA8626615.1 BTB domain-containing protein [Pyrenophora tritici-repentis]KAF7455045.1 BTB domain containing protein [Pyrenophora tritici-repentis]KAF7578196.1 BTB domain containing protein [Pyrenophora tritici-repentis]